jgi:ABC-type dipeptide/oligopeptide/nickel transport system permease component
MSNLAVFTIRRLLAMMIILYTVATLVFLLAHASPADPATMLLDQQATNQQARLSLRHAFGLDQPLWQQYVQYLSGAVHGTFGMSEAPGTFQQPVTTLLNERVPTTLKLGGMALLLALLVGLPIGFLSALKPNSRTDHGSQLSMMVLYALPIIVVAPIAQLIFGVELRWLPVAGWGAPGWLGIREMILPVSTYGLGIAGYFSQSFRSILLEVLHHDYIRTARAKGVKEWLVVLRHAGKNTLVPLASIVGRIYHRILFQHSGCWPRHADISCERGCPCDRGNSRSPCGLRGYRECAHRYSLRHGRSARRVVGRCPWCGTRQ